MSMYAKVRNGIIEKIGPRPKWLYEGGVPVEDDAEYAKDGWLPIVHDRPAYDPETHRIRQNPQSEWLVGGTQVTATYTVEARPPPTIKQLHAYLLRRREEVIAEGVTVTIDDTPNPVQ